MIKLTKKSLNLKIFKKKAKLKRDDARERLRTDFIKKTDRLSPEIKDLIEKDLSHEKDSTKSSNLRTIEQIESETC